MTAAAESPDPPATPTGPPRPTARLTALAVGVVLAAVMAIVPRATFTDGAMFGEDTWEYQSLAVNLALGEGFHRFGGMIEDFSVYKFDEDRYFNRDYIAPFYERAGQFDVYRTPGYTTLLGLFYKVVGVRPLWAKWAQVGLIALAALMLPAIGALTWRRTGYWLGLAAIAPMIWLNYQFASEIRTESLIILMVAAFVLLGCMYQHWPNWRLALTWGACTGLCALVKGSMAFFPLLAGLFLLWRWWRDRRRATFLLIVLYSVAFWAVLAPWSIYASRTHGQRVLLSTQGEYVMLDNHNEYCADGYWHPEWLDNPDSFYNTDGMAGRPAALRVANFYWHNPGQLLNNWQSVRLAYVANGFLPLAALALALLGGLTLLEGPIARTPKLWLPAKTICVVAIAAGFLTCLEGALDPLRGMRYDGFHLASYVGAAVAVVVLRRRLRLWLAPAMMMVLVNFLAITLMTGTVDTEYYRSRFIKVADSVHVLLAVYLLWEVVIRLRALRPPPGAAPPSAATESA